MRNWVRHSQQHFVFRLGNGAAGKCGFDQDLREHLPQVLAHHRLPCEAIQRLLQAEISLFALVEQPDCPLPVITGNLHPLHQRLDHADLVLGHLAIRLAQMAQGGEQGVKKSFLGRAHADDSGQEAIYQVAQQHTDQGAADAALQQAENSANDFSPPVAGNFE